MGRKDETEEPSGRGKTPQPKLFWAGDFRLGLRRAHRVAHYSSVLTNLEQLHAAPQFSPVQLHGLQLPSTGSQPLTPQPLPVQVPLQDRVAFCRLPS